MAKCSNDLECWKFFGMRDDLAFAAALASDDVTLQHQWPAVILRSLSHAVEFCKGIGLRRFICSELFLLYSMVT